MKTKLQLGKRPAAVALGYDEQTKAAPHVLASGTSAMAAEMERVARRYGIPIKTNSKAANALASLEWGEEIPPQFYETVARIFAELEQTAQNNHKKSRP